MANNRLFFACEQGGIKGDGIDTGYRAIHGLQTAGMTTNFGLENIQEQGQLAVYETKEEVPTIDVTMSKVLDGYPLIYHEATFNATSPTLAGRSTSKCLISLAYFAETADSATGTPYSQVQVSGAFVTGLNYSFPIRGNMTEEVTFQANNKMWANDPRVLQSAPWIGAESLNFTGAFSSLDSPVGSGGVNRRQNLIFLHGKYTGDSTLDSNGMAGDPDATILPPEIFGISTSGTNELLDANTYTAHIQNITVRSTFNREDLYEQGHFAPYTKVLNFPVETTCEITATAVSGDMVSATAQGILQAAVNQCSTSRNLGNRTIRVATCEGTRLYLGTKCKLSSVAQNGGDAAGGNLSLTYNFISYSYFTVLHSGDPNANSATWWNSRSTYLVN